MLCDIKLGIRFFKVYKTNTSSTLQIVITKKKYAIAYKYIQFIISRYVIIFRYTLMEHFVMYFFCVYFTPRYILYSTDEHHTTV